MKTIIAGCGRLGAGLAERLAEAGHQVTVVDIAEAAFARLGPTFTGERLVGVGFDRDVLVRAGIDGADGLAAVTGSDEANAVIARVAQRIFRVPRVVARIYDPGKAAIYRRLGVQVISPVDWGIQRLAELLSFGTIGELLSLGSGQVDLVEAELPALLGGRPIGELAAPGEVLPVAISRSGRTFIPTEGVVLETGDIVHLAVVAASRRRLESLLDTR